MAGKHKNISEGWLTKQLETILANAKPLEHGGEEGRGYQYYSTRGSYTMDPSLLSIVDGIVSKILSSPLYGSYIAEKSAEDLLQKAILETIETEDAKRSARMLLSALGAGHKELEVVVPLEGIIFREGRSLTLGKVKIEKFNACRAKLHTLPHRAPIVMEGMGTATHHSAQWGETNAVVTFAALGGSAFDIATKLVEEAIDVFRVFLNIMAIPPDSAYFGIRGTRAAYRQVMTGYCYSTCGVEASHSFVGPGDSIEITRTKLGLIRSNKYFKALSKILGTEKKDLNGFENRLIVSARWLGRSYAESDVKMRFLFAAICLESLLSLSKVEMTEHLAVCIPHICEEETSKKRELYKVVKKLYSKRSLLVHAGSDEIDLKDVGIIRLVARHILLFALDNWPEVTNDNEWSDVLIGLKTQ